MIKTAAQEEEYKMITNMWVKHGKTYAEISDFLNIPKSRVKLTLDAFLVVYMADNKNKNSLKGPVPVFEDQPIDDRIKCISLNSLLTHRQVYDMTIGEVVLMAPNNYLAVIEELYG